MQSALKTVYVWIPVRKGGGNPPGTLPSGLPSGGRDSVCFENPVTPSRSTHNPIVVQFSPQLQHHCLRSLFLLRNGSSFLAFCVFVRQPCDAGTDAYPRPYNPFLFCKKMKLGRMPIFTKQPRASTFQNKICTVVEQWIHGYFCLGCLSSPTHFYLVTRLAHKMWRQCVLVCGHDRYSHARNCICLFSDTGLFWFPLVTNTFSTFNANDSFRLFTTAPDSILPLLASKIRNRNL